MAELARAALRDRRRDDAAAARRLRRDRAAPPPAPPRARARHARPALGGTPRRAADRQLAPGRVRRARRAVRERGALLDEHLAAWEGLWRDTPASFAGEHYAYEDVYLEPKAWRPDGPRLWLGGESVHPRLLRRIVRYAHGFHPLGQPSEADLAAPARGSRRGGPRPRRARARGRHAGRVPGRRAARRRSSRRSRRSRRSSSAASRRSASSRRSSSTTSPSTRPGAARSSSGSGSSRR